MDPTLRKRVAHRENGLRKAAVVTTVAVVAGAAAAVGVSVALASNDSTTSYDNNSGVQQQDQLQPPANQLGAGSGRRSHTSSGAS
jgi:hypothetical protein